MKKKNAQKRHQQQLQNKKQWEQQLLAQNIVVFVSFICCFSDSLRRDNLLNY